LITYFGYGSLVNRATRPAGEVSHPAILHGWHRSWAHRIIPTATRGRSCSLTVKKAAASLSVSIHGVVASMPRTALAELDAREAGYDRLMLPASSFDLPLNCQASEVAVYVSTQQNHHPACEQYPILQSYVDCVMAGYLAEFGEAGLAAFMASTEGWHRPVENDRFSPRYPRAVSLAKPLLESFAKLMGQHSLR
jgi:hypothetical protein